MTVLTFAAVIALTGLAGAPESKTISFKTSDGVTIEADYYAPPPPQVVRDSKQVTPETDSKKSSQEITAPAKDKTGAAQTGRKDSPVAKAPVAVLIHMYPADRKSWLPIIPRLHEAGFAVLAYDIRGKGGSNGGATSKLAKQYDERDPSMFADAWRDCEAAVKWLAAKPECDVSRVVCIGASIGCSVSIQYGAMNPGVRAVVCLSPGIRYFGVDSVDHIRKLMPRDALLIAPEGEYAAVTKLILASDGKATGAMYPGGRDQHGTNLFADGYSRRDEIMNAITEFVTKAVSK